MTDASAEGETIAVALRARGLHVIDAPLALLGSRLSGEQPRVVVLDVDEPGALEEIDRLRARFGPDLAIVCVGIRAQAAPLASELGERFFDRPVDVQRLGKLVADLGPRNNASRPTTPPPSYAPRPTLPPPHESERSPNSDAPPAQLDDMLDEFGIAEDALGPLPLGAPIPLSPELDAILLAAEERLAAEQARSSNAPSSEEGASDDGRPLPLDLLSALDEPLGPGENDHDGTGAPDGTGTPTGWPREGSEMHGTGHGTGHGAGHGTGTSERESHTRDGRDSVQRPDRSRPGFDVGLETGTSDEEILQGVEARRAVETVPPGPGSAAPPSVPATGTHPFGSDTGLGPPFSPAPASSSEVPHRAFEEPPLRTPSSSALGLPAALRALPSLELQPSPSLSWDRQSEARSAQPHGGPSPVTTSSPPLWAGPMTAQLPSPAAHLGNPTSGVGPATQNAPSGPVTAREAPTALPEVFTAEDAPRVVAQAIAMRCSGALAMRTDSGTRHILLHEGDLVTAASTSADESLAAFLVERGDLGREVLTRLGARLPTSGRLAGAALVANGYLAQDDLWPVLRTHAEWIVARALVTGPGSCQLETEPSPRLKSEPGVFGGAAGAEIFVEIIRRTIPPSVAVARLGGLATRLDQGPRLALLAECALQPELERIVRGLSGRTVGEAIERAGDEVASVLLALADLDVAALLSAPRPEDDKAVAVDDPLDDEAVRVRVRARLSLVREGDYFAVLGVARDATAYEIKRAYLELRRTFEPSRLLSARTLDLMPEVRLLLEVADEAYDILKEQNRRDRYRRAIELGPPE